MAGAGSPLWALSQSERARGRQALHHGAVLQRRHGRDAVKDGENVLSWPSNISSTPVEVGRAQQPALLPLQAHALAAPAVAERYRGGLGQDILIESRSHPADRAERDGRADEVPRARPGRRRRRRARRRAHQRQARRSTPASSTCWSAAIACWSARRAAAATARRRRATDGRAEQDRALGYAAGRAGAARTAPGDHERGRKLRCLTGNARRPSRSARFSPSR